MSTDPTGGDRKAHWERVYALNSPDSVSWFESTPDISLRLIEKTQLSADAAIIDIGAGASALVDHLLARQFSNLTVLEISGRALDLVRRRLGATAANVNWIEGDVTTFVPRQKYALWHDRAVFHFLTEKKARDDYVRALEAALVPGGHLVIATFAKDGPRRCSGLDVVRYDELAMSATLGAKFSLIEAQHATHLTPTGKEQNFMYFLFRMSDDNAKFEGEPQ